MNVSTFNSSIMNFNFVNNEHSDSTDSRPSVFSNSTYKPIEWSQVTPQQMPWAQNPALYSTVMTFGSPNFFQPQTQQIVPFNPVVSSSNSCNTSLQVSDKDSFGNIPNILNHNQHVRQLHKRKADINISNYAKQRITEERMAAHMSRLHISSETPIVTDKHSNGEETEPPVERQKRLVMCEEMRRLQTESIIPAALMKRSVNESLPNGNDITNKYNYYRLERPCMAVMLWQPPDKVIGRLPVLPSTSTGQSSVIIEEIDNNNSSAVNLNNNNNNRNANNLHDEDDKSPIVTEDVMDMDL